MIVGIDFTNNKKEESGPGGPGREPSAHWDTSSSSMPSAVPLQPLPSGALAAGVASSTAIPSAASLTSAGATSASSVHIPISILSAGSAATPAPEESVSTVCKRLPKRVCGVGGLASASLHLLILCVWY